MTISNQSTENVDKAVNWRTMPGMFNRGIQVINFEIPVARLMKTNQNGHDFTQAQADLAPIKWTVNLGGFGLL
jgi:hypothetical protein